MQEHFEVPVPMSLSANGSPPIPTIIQYGVEIDIYIYTNIHIYIHIYIYTYVHTFVSIHAIYVYVYPYIHLTIYTYLSEYWESEHWENAGSMWIVSY